MITTNIKPKIHEMKEKISDHFEKFNKNRVCSPNTKQKLKENKL